MSEPFLYLEDLEKAKKPSARAPASAAGSPSPGKANVKPPTDYKGSRPFKVKNPGASAGAARAPANPTPAPQTPSVTPTKAPDTPKLTPEQAGADDLVACPFGGGAECEKAGGSGGAMHEPNGESMRAHSRYQASQPGGEGTQTGDQGEAQAEPQEPKASGVPEEGQAAKPRVVSSGASKEGPVSSSPDKVAGEGKPSAASIEASKNKDVKSSDHKKDLKAFTEKNPDWSKKQFIEDKTYDQHLKQARTELDQGNPDKAIDSAAKAAYLSNFLKDHPSKTSTETRELDDLIDELSNYDDATMGAAIDKVVEEQERPAEGSSVDAKASKEQSGKVDAYRSKEKAAGREPYKAGPPSSSDHSARIDSKKTEMQGEQKATDDAAEVKETRDAEKHDADMKHKAAQTAQVEAKTKQIGKPTPTSSKPADKKSKPKSKPASGKSKPRNLTYKKNTKKDPKGTQSSFGFGEKEKPTKKTGSPAGGHKPTAPKKATAPKKGSAPKKDSAPKKPTAPKKDKKQRDPQLVLDLGDNKRKEVAAENAKRRAAAGGTGGPSDPGGTDGGTPKKGKQPKEGKKGKKNNYSTAFNAGRLAGTRFGEAAATAEAGGYILSGGVEYGVGGVLKVGQHLLNSKANNSGKEPSKKPSVKPQKLRGTEVSQSSMKSLPLYLDLFKAVTMPNAGNTTPDDKRAKLQHEASYAKRPIGVANEGIVTEDDPDKGKKWKTSDEDSVQTSVEDMSKPKKDEDEDEEKTEKSIDPSALLRDMNSRLRNEVSKSLPNSMESVFMVDELGYDPIKVSRGQMSISGKNRGKFNSWAHDRLAKSIALFTEIVK